MPPVAAGDDGNFSIQSFSKFSFLIHLSSPMTNAILPAVFYRSSTEPAQHLLTFAIDRARTSVLDAQGRRIPLPIAIASISVISLMISKFISGPFKQVVRGDSRKPSNAALQLRRAISSHAEGNKLLEKDAIAPSAASVLYCALPGKRHPQDVVFKTVCQKTSRTVLQNDERLPG